MSGLNEIMSCYGVVFCIGKISLARLNECSLAFGKLAYVD